MSTRALAISKRKQPTASFNIAETAARDFRKGQWRVVKEGRGCQLQMLSNDTERWLWIRLTRDETAQLAAALADVLRG